MINAELANQVAADSETHRYLAACSLLGTAVHTLIDCGVGRPEILQTVQQLLLDSLNLSSPGTNPDESPPTTRKSHGDR
jgi:hypothetical protein